MGDTEPLKQNEVLPTHSSPVKSPCKNGSVQIQKEACVSVVQEHDLSEPNEQYELKFDFTGKIKNYASSRWKGWLKWVLIIGGIFVAALIFSIVTYEVWKYQSWCRDGSNIPGLELVSSSNIIQFEEGVPRSFESYTQYLKTYLEDYSAISHASMRNCTGQSTSTQTQACIFDVKSELGFVCSYSVGEFGYDEGQPCILLKVKRVKDWVPDPFTPLDAIPPAIVGVWKPDHVLITCTGESQNDRRNIGEVSYYPHAGVPTKYFPFVGQEPFQDPLIFVQFHRLKPDVAINVKCELWSQDVSDADKDRAAVRFTFIFN